VEVVGEVKEMEMPCPNPARTKIQAERDAEIALEPIEKARAEPGA
jgi:hypothetical protein